MIIVESLGILPLYETWDKKPCPGTINYQRKPHPLSGPLQSGVPLYDSETKKATGGNY